MLAEGQLDPGQAKAIFAKARNRKELKKAKLKPGKLTRAA